MRPLAVGALLALITASTAGAQPTDQPTGQPTDQPTDQPAGLGGDPAGDPAVTRAFFRAQASVLPSIVEVEALGGIPEAHKAPTTQAQGEKQGVLVKRGFKQAFGPSTGLVVSEDGYIATSTFVLNRSPRFLIVTLSDGRSFVAKLVGRDDSRALAILKIDAADLAVPSFAKRSALRVGRFALTMGRGLATERPAVSLGILSGLARVGGRALQSSAAISPVNYGGPLVGVDGSVFGLLVPLAPRGGMAGVDLYDSGIGFAIPAPDLLALLGRLTAGDGDAVVELRAGWLGIALDSKHRGGGVRVAQVAPSSPAARAKLVVGDVIREVDRVAVDAPWQLRHALGRKFAGDPLTLEVEWQGTPRTVKLKLAPRPKGPQTAPPGHPEGALPEEPGRGG